MILFKVRFAHFHWSLFGSIGFFLFSSLSTSHTSPARLFLVSILYILLIRQRYKLHNVNKDKLKQRSANQTIYVHLLSPHPPLPNLPNPHPRPILHSHPLLERQLFSLPQVPLPPWPSLQVWDLHEGRAPDLGDEGRLHEVFVEEGEGLKAGVYYDSVWWWWWCVREELLRRRRDHVGAIPQHLLQTYSL